MIHEYFILNNTVISLTTNLLDEGDGEVLVMPFGVEGLTKTKKQKFQCKAR